MSQLIHIIGGKHKQSDVKTMRQYEWLLLILLSDVWGGLFFFVGVAVEALPPLTIVSLRVSLAALALLAVVHLTSLRIPLNPETWVSFIFMGILNNAIPFSLIVWGQKCAKGDGFIF